MGLKSVIVVGEEVESLQDILNKIEERQSHFKSSGLVIKSSGRKITKAMRRGAFKNDFHARRMLGKDF